MISYKKAHEDEYHNNFFHRQVYHIYLNKNKYIKNLYLKYYLNYIVINVFLFCYISLLYYQNILLFQIF